MTQITRRQPTAHARTLTAAHIGACCLLARHYGEPMIGAWEPVGIVASLVLAVGGLLVGVWGFSRRDLRS